MEDRVFAASTNRERSRRLLTVLAVAAAVLIAGVLIYISTINGGADWAQSHTDTSVRWAESLADKKNPSSPGAVAEHVENSLKEINRQTVRSIQWLEEQLAPSQQGQD